MIQKGPACRQAGLAPIFIILIIAVAVTLAGGAYYLGTKRPEMFTPSSQQPESINKTDETVYTEATRSANWKTYYSSYMGLELKYPADWKIKTDSQYPQQFDLYPPESDPELPSINLSLSLSDIPFNSNPSPSPDMSPFKPIVIAGITGIYSEYMPPKLGELRLPLVGGECQQPYEINLPVKNKTLFIFSCKSLQPRFEKILDNLVLK